MCTIAHTAGSYHNSDDNDNKDDFNEQRQTNAVFSFLETKRKDSDDDAHEQGPSRASGRSRHKVGATVFVRR